MVPASKLNDLYKQLEELAGKTLLEIPSRSADVCFFDNFERLAARTWQQNDLYIFSHWLPRGRDSVSLNLKQHYQKPSDLDHYLPLMEAQADSIREDSKVLSIYLTFALIKNYLLLQKIRIKTLDPNDEKVSGSQLLNFTKIEAAKKDMLVHAGTARDKLINVGCKDLAMALYAEIEQEFKGIALSAQLILNTKICEYSTPTTAVKKTSPMNQQVELPAPPMVEISLSPPPFRAPPPSPCEATPPPTYSVPVYTRAQQAEVEAECEVTVPRWCLMFSSCLPFVKMNAREEPNNINRAREMEPMGYVAMDDGEEHTPSSLNPFARHDGYVPLKNKK